jgi:ribosomal protein S18 acetylase RimI-like enzyme
MTEEKNQSNLVITFGIPDDQRTAVADMLVTTFREKFTALFGHRNDLIAFLSSTFCDQRTLVALSHDKVVGIAGLVCGGKEFISVNWRTLLFHPALLLRIIFIGWIFFKRVEKEELFIDVLAVRKEHRGKGVGRQLIEYIKAYGRCNRFTSISLHVVDTNMRAKKFYESMGFVERRLHRIVFPWNRLFSFNGAYEMRYTI